MFAVPSTAAARFAQMAFGHVLGKVRRNRGYVKYCCALECTLSSQAHCSRIDASAAYSQRAEVALTQVASTVH
eukprot:1646249-Amphidinium_carterae.1